MLGVSGPSPGHVELLLQLPDLLLGQQPVQAGPEQGLRDLLQQTGLK